MKQIPGEAEHKKEMIDMCKAIQEMYDDGVKDGIQQGKIELLKEQIQRKQVLYQDIENTFKNFFGTKVRLDAGRRKGKIIIEYSSNDDLERILNLMK